VVVVRHHAGRVRARPPSPQCRLLGVLTRRRGPEVVVEGVGRTPGVLPGGRRQRRRPPLAGGPALDELLRSPDHVARAGGLGADHTCLGLGRSIGTEQPWRGRLLRHASLLASKLWSGKIVPAKRGPTCRSSG